VRATGLRLTTVNDGRASVAVLATAPKHGLECIDRLTGQRRDRQAAEQWAYVQADRCVVSDAGGDLDIQDLEVAIHELVDGGACARVALLVTCPMRPAFFTLRSMHGDRPELTR